jgi:hypothetical protein
MKILQEENEQGLAACTGAAAHSPTFLPLSLQKNYPFHFGVARKMTLLLCR